MPAPTTPQAAPPDLSGRAIVRLRALGAALRDVWQGYWDRPIGC